MQLVAFTQNPHALEFYVELARLGGYDTVGEGSTPQESTMNDPLLGGLDASKVRTMAVSCPALTAWVEAGVVEPGGPAPVDTRAGSSSDKAGRVKAVTDYLTDELGEFIKNGEILRRSAQIGVELTAEHEMLHYLAAARDQLLATSPATPTVVAQKSSNGLS